MSDVTEHRPSYYLALDLDPTVDEWSVIEARIDELRLKWSAQTVNGNQAQRRKAKWGLDNLAEIRATLADPAKRKVEASAAAKERQAGREEREKSLEASIAVLKRTGQCTREQIELLAKESGGVYTREEIEERVRRAGIQVAGAAQPSNRPAKKRLDDTVAEKIRVELGHLGLKNLYEVLGAGASPKSSVAVLRARADELFKALQRDGKTDSFSSARSSLAGFAMSTFSSEQEKEKYDNTLALESMERLRPQLEIAGQDKFIETGELDELVKLARGLGVAGDDARQYIEDYAAKRGWRVQGATSLPSDALRTCGFCSTLARTKDDERCASCGQALSLACPRCQAPNPRENAACAKCGAHRGDAPVMFHLLKEGREHALRGTFEEALRAFDTILVHWGGWPSAVEARAEAQKKKSARDEALTVVERLAVERKMIAAQAALDRLSRDHASAAASTVAKRIEQAIRQAESIFQDAEMKRRAGHHELAFERYVEALDHAADHAGARQALTRAPPAAPTSLVVQESNSGYRVSWTASTSKGAVSYRVVRKAGGLPSSPAEGAVSQEVSVTRFDDLAADSGTRWFYAVYAVRAGITSTEAATSGPHLLAAEVRDLTAQVGDAEVVLRWSMPNGAVRVEVWRRADTPPRHVGDGASIPAAGREAHDTRLTNGATYHYLVAAVYPHPRTQGTVLTTTGVRVSATPIAPPRPVLDLKAKRQGKSVLLSWSPIPGAGVQVRQSTRAPDVAPGFAMRLADAARFGAMVPATSAGTAQVDLSGPGETFFVPLSVAGEVAIVGQPASASNVDPVSNLRTQAVGRSIILTWTWPAGVDEVLVGYALDDYPEGPDNGRGTWTTVNRAGYERSAGWELFDPAKTRHYFTLLARAPRSNHLSSPEHVVETLGYTVAVSYRVVLKKGLLGGSIKDAWVELECRERDHLGELLVVGKAREVPLTPDDGQVIAEVGSVRFESGKAKIPIPKDQQGKPLFVKLFFRNAHHLQEIRLLPADRESLRLG